MSRRSFTTLTFKVRLRMPQGSSIPKMQAFIRAAIVNERDLVADTDPLHGLALQELTIKLDGKETTYL